MPKGQYQRRPREAEAAAPNEWGTTHNAEVERIEALAEAAPARTTGYLQAHIEQEPALRAALHERAPIAGHRGDPGPEGSFTPPSAADIAEVARLLAEPAPPAAITRESFDDWLDADAVTMPPNDRITQMVGEWAASFCDVEHSVTWLPSLDRTSLTVTLVTPYGTSDLVANAGQWREADIAEALASMRGQLGV